MVRCEIHASDVSVIKAFEAATHKLRQRTRTRAGGGLHHDHTTHPGEVLREDFMIPLGLSANALSRALDVPPNRITSIIADETHAALRLTPRCG
jgi:hypothetical protein